MRSEGLSDLPKAIKLVNVGAGISTQVHVAQISAFFFFLFQAYSCSSLHDGDNFFYILYCLFIPTTQTYLTYVQYY